MPAIETTLTPWEPGLGMTAFDDASNYMGERLSGWFVFSKHRDSDLLAQSNYDCILHRLNAVAESSGVDCVEQHTFGHWAVGHVDQIVLSAESPIEVIREAEQIISALADYPVLDESDWSEREWMAQADYWDSMSARDKVSEAIRIRERHHWLVSVPAWPLGRLDWSELSRIADSGDAPISQLARAVYDIIQDSIR